MSGHTILSLCLMYDYRLLTMTRRSLSAAVGSRLVVGARNRRASMQSLRSETGSRPNQLPL